MDARARAMGSVFVAGLLVAMGVARLAFAHCDTLDGPVVADARKALGAGDVTPVLKWVRAEDEPEIRAAFQRTLAVRAKGREAQELADLYFFETLVRVHRAGEGEPYTGLEPGGAEVNPAVRAADAALEKGTVDSLLKSLSEHMAAAVGERFQEAAEKRKHQDESVEAGREAVAAYVEFVHFVERLHDDVAAPAHHAEPAAAPASAEQHYH